MFTSEFQGRWRHLPNLKASNVALFCVVFSTTFAQVPTTITYDSRSGNYLIRYQGESGAVETIFEPATYVNPVIQVHVTREQGANAFRYGYSVRNSPNSRQRIYSFSVEYHSQIADITKPADQWTAEPFSRLPIVNWAHSLVEATGAKSRRSGIAQDSSVTGFSYQSTGLPSIVSCYSEGLTRTLRFPEEPPEDVDSLLSPIQEFPHNAVHRYTIGARDPLANISPPVFLDTLLSYTRQSAQLGWLGRNRDDDCDDDERPDDGVVRNIENRLQKARRELVRGDSVKARGELVKLVRKVDRLQRRGERVMTSEAYALLKYNTEYLIERLPERRRR